MYAQLYTIAFIPILLIGTNIQIAIIISFLHLRGRVFWMDGAVELCKDVRLCKFHHFSNLVMSKLQNKAKEKPLIICNSAFFLSWSILRHTSF